LRETDLCEGLVARLLRRFKNIYRVYAGLVYRVTGRSISNPFAAKRDIVQKTYANYACCVTLFGIFQNVSWTLILKIFDKLFVIIWQHSMSSNPTICHRSIAVISRFRSKGTKGFNGFNVLVDKPINDSTTKLI